MKKRMSAFIAALGLAAASAHATVTINEIRIDQPGSDNDEYFELAGDPGESLDGMTYIVIGDGAAAAGSGVIEVVVSLDGRSIPADGYFLAVESTFTIGGELASADFNTGAALNFENGDNVTHMLVRGFTGLNGQDLDTNDDCALDITPWTSIVDSVSLFFADPPASECTYATRVGPDGAFVPGRVFRCPNGSGGWQIGSFADTAADSPGSANPSGPTITTDPSGLSVCEGGSATFMVAASGVAPLSYQWRKDGLDLGGETADTLAIDPVLLADAGDYDCVVTDACGSATSAAATLTVTSSAPPSITQQPFHQVKPEGATASFQVVASGSGTLLYQWRKDGLDIGGETSDTLTISPVAAADAGSYDVVVTDTCGMTTSDAAVLVVGAPIRINEIRIDQPGTDNDEFFELTGAPGAPLDGLTYLVLGDSAAGSGVIEAVVPLGGSTMPGDGFFLAVEDTFTLGGGLASADLVLSGASNGINFENTDNVTHLLVLGFSGASGQDLDTNDDGVLDASPWVEELDRIAVIIQENPPTTTEFHYGPPTVGPDGMFAPGLAFRCPDGSGTWTVGVFALGSQDTPGGPNAGPRITTQPASASACLGGMATFTVVASGTEPLSYQWRLGGGDLPGETTDTLVIDPVTALDAGSYTVVVSNECGSVESAPAVLTVETVPSIDTDPVDADVCEGDTVMLSVVASGAGPFSYQWRKDGIDLAGETADTLALGPVLVGDAGDYDVVVSNSCGSVTSAAATVTVAPLYRFRTGNVNGGVGPVADVLFINGSAGFGPERKLTLIHDDPITFFMSNPPSRATAKWAAYAFVGEPTKSDSRILPFGLGESAMPLPISMPRPSSLKKIWNNIGRFGLLGAPDLPSVMAPTTFLNRMTGVVRPVVFTVQGVIVDPNAPNGQAATTNGIVVDAQ